MSKEKEHELKDRTPNDHGGTRCGYAIERQRQREKETEKKEVK